MEFLEYKNYEVVLELGEYENGNLAIQMFDTADNVPVATCTVNIEDMDMGNGEVFIKNYSENEGMFNWFKKNNLVEEVLGFASNGYVTVPKVKLNMDKLERVVR